MGTPTTVLDTYTPSVFEKASVGTPQGDFTASLLNLAQHIGAACLGSDMPQEGWGHGVDTP